MSAGFVVWFYTLLLPTFADAGLIASSFLREGPFGIELLRPQSLLGVDGIDEVSHSMFWSMLVNVGAYVAVSLASRPSPQEQAQAVLFVNALADPVRPRLWRERVSVGELRTLLEQFIGPAAAAAVMRGQSAQPRLETAAAEPELVHHVETVLAGSVGAASARLVIASVAGEEQLRVDEVMEMIDEASHVAALEERHRLARELHDSVSQALFSMTLHTRAVEMAVQREGGDPNGRVVRGLSRAADPHPGRPRRDARLDLPAPSGRAARGGPGGGGGEARGGGGGPRRAGDRGAVPGDRLPLDDRAEEELFRVVQEALHNCVKHARPTRVDIRMDGYSAADGALVIEIVDDGVGFDPSASMPGHLGLETMRERTQRIGGWLTVDSSPEGSTTVRATLPPSSRHWSARRGRAMTADGDGAAPIRVFLVDDHAVVRRGMRAFFEMLDDIEVLGEASDGQAALDELAVRGRPRPAAGRRAHGPAHAPARRRRRDPRDQAAVPGRRGRRADQLQRG